MPSNSPPARHRACDPATEPAAASPPPASRVLLLLDVQHAMLSDPPLGVPAAHTVAPNIARVLAAARSAPHPPLVVHVRNAGAAGEPDEPGCTGWQLVHRALPPEPVLDKTKNALGMGQKGSN